MGKPGVSSTPTVIKSLTLGLSSCPQPPPDSGRAFSALQVKVPYNEHAPAVDWKYAGYQLPRAYLDYDKIYEPRSAYTLCAACDIYRYRPLDSELGVKGYHDNCSDNLHHALNVAAIGEVQHHVNVETVVQLVGLLNSWTPYPLNLFMNIPWKETVKGDIEWEAPASNAGDFVELRGERDNVLVCMSA